MIWCMQCVTEAEVPAQEVCVPGVECSRKKPCDNTMCWAPGVLEDAIGQRNESRRRACTLLPENKTVACERCYADVFLYSMKMDFAFDSVGAG